MSLHLFNVLDFWMLYMEKDTDTELESAMHSLDNANLLGVVLNKAKSLQQNHLYQNHYAATAPGAAN